MPYRGSLPKCIDQLGYYFRSEPNGPHLILFNPRGNYYTALRYSESGDFADRRDSSEHRLVCQVTKSELKALMTHPQILLI
jgi:hypothetical protein